jgi:flagellar biosynthesis chaperone FliJ
VKEIKTAVEADRREHQRQDNGSARELGTVSAQLGSIQRAVDALGAALQEQRKEFDSKLGTAHRRLDALRAPH